MQQILVSDTSVLIDLKRGSLLEASFRLAFRFFVPDLLYERELKDWGGEDLTRLGLVIEQLDGAGVSLALAYRKRMPALSLPDCFALALAQIHSWVLLSGDSALSRLATDEEVECHGVLWLLGKMHDANVVSIRKLHNGLTAISQHPRCRLPKTEVRRRLSSYADRLR
ncbi:MAG: hypothetical protein F4142_00355 [Nitrospira sp. SB0675_bin_23]|nr:hypothetical protein [Nitrospira sp. SB0667_bin_9]MYD31992.1 hypothetical protein [Nitrospira sp. SB0661_bin_20]MYH01049.1 hypothetical protein [Nitrospira sp. SB0675_bin_23]MYJ22994.1 hypothetical protein [Nitrospira sp. SB0673_bin_12]